MNAFCEALSIEASSNFTHNNTDSAYSAHTMLSAYFKACLAIILRQMPEFASSRAHRGNLPAEAGSAMDQTHNEKNADQRNPSRGVASCHS